jgi:hypothetical protein
MRKGVFDRVLEKAVSRKLFTFLTATGLMLFSDLDSETWGLIAVVYIAGQSVVDVMKTYRFGSAGNEEL